MNILIIADGDDGNAVRLRLNEVINRINDNVMYCVYAPAQDFTDNNLVLEERWIGVETDTITTLPKIKIGDGVTAWIDLPYFTGSIASITGTLVDNTDPANPVINRPTYITADGQVDTNIESSAGFNILRHIYENRLISAENRIIGSVKNSFDSALHEFINGNFSIISANGDQSIDVTDNLISIAFNGSSNSGGFGFSNTQLGFNHDGKIAISTPLIEYSAGGTLNNNMKVINNVPDATSALQPINKQQFDTYNNSVGGNRGDIDCSANPNYPASNKGDRWEVTVAGKIGGVSGIVVQVYDEIVCKATSVSGDQATVGASFYVIQGNIERATESTAGYTSFADDAEMQTGTDNTKAVNVLKLSNWFTWVKTQVQTFAAKITFTIAPRFSSATASTPLAVDSNKDLVSLTDAIEGAFIGSLTAKTTPVDADYDVVMDSADSNKAKKVSFANRKATLKAYFDVLYSAKQDGLVSGGAVTVGTYGGSGSNNDIRVAVATWCIASTNYSTGANTDFLDIALSAAGLQRFVGLYGDTANTIIKVEGAESEYALYPATPGGHALISYVLVTDSATSSTPDLSGYMLISSKAAASDVRIGSNDTKYITSKQLKDSNVLQKTILQVGYLTAFSPVDSTAYYFGSPYVFVPVTAVNALRQVKSPVKASKAMVFLTFVGTGGTTEGSVISIYNSTSGLTTPMIASFVCSGQRNEISAEVSIVVNVGDTLQIKWDTPAWVTNPTNTQMSGYIALS